MSRSLDIKGYIDYNIDIETNVCCSLLKYDVLYFYQVTRMYFLASNVSNTLKWMTGVKPYTKIS